MDGYYYLHTGGDLIFKPTSVVNADPEYFDSPFVRKVWPIDKKDRATAYITVIEAAVMGAHQNRLNHLIDHWGLTDDDAKEFCQRARFDFEWDENIVAGPGWRVTHQDDDPKDQIGEGSSLILALISYARRGPLGAQA